jgi:hypothetical protein
MSKSFDPLHCPGGVSLPSSSIFKDYGAAKVKIRRQNIYPDPVVKTTSPASGTPPDVWYRIFLPEETIKNWSYSALQLQTINFCYQQHE